MVLVAPGEMLRALAERVAGDAAEVMPFAELDALPALEAILTRKPAVVAIERSFATTARGSALINRINSDPDLEGTEIRLVGHDATYTPYAAAEAEADDTQPEAGGGTVATLSPPSDYRGTRRTPRIKLAGQRTVQVDGNQAQLVDLSSSGAQVVSGPILKPNQRVRVSLADEGGVLRVTAVIAWASFEIAPKTGPRYRAGLEFVNVEPQTAAALEAYCARYKHS
jgi:hypothetical protein